jgi:hypothetical protein
MAGGFHSSISIDRRACQAGSMECPLGTATTRWSVRARKEPAVARAEKRIDRAHWVSLKPFWVGEQKPNNYLELWRAFNEDRDEKAATKAVA